MEEAHAKLDRLELKLKVTREKTEQTKKKAERYRTLIETLDAEAMHYYYKTLHLSHKLEMLKNSLE